MTVTLTGSGGLFTILKLAITASDNAQTNHGTTIPTNIESTIDEMADLGTVEGAQIAERLASSTRSYRTVTTIPSAIKTFAQALIVDRVTSDAPQVPSSIDDCITELIRQMDAAGTPETVEENVVSVAVTPPDANAPTLLLSVVDGLGDDCEAVVDETIVGTFINTTQMAITSGPVQNNRLVYDWPKGSGLNTSLTVQTDGLLSNQSFDTDTSVTNLPDNWIGEVVTIGTTVALTVSEIQTITKSGSPTSGWFTISHTNNNGDKQTTAPLQFDASAAEVESALANFVGWSDVSVTYATNVWTINFNAVTPAGDQVLLTTDENFDTGSLAVAEATAGQDSYEYRALAILGSGGTELTRLRQRGHELSFSPNTVYAVSIQAKIVTGTTGNLIIELVDGSNTVMTNDAGNNLRITIDLSTVSDSAFEAQTGFFQMPAVIPDIWYVQIRLGADLADTKGVYLDDFIITEAKRLYSDGPYAALIANHRDLADDDRYTVTVSNNWAGKIQSWFYRWFERLLPSATSGAETIADP